MSDAIDAMEHAFSGEVEAPLRSLVGSSLVMPGRLDDTTAVKIVSIVPGSPSGLVVVFGADGSPIGIVDGPTLTAIRTGAVAGLATKMLAAESASSLAMVGAGSDGLGPDRGRQRGQKDRQDQGLVPVDREGTASRRPCRWCCCHVAR